MLSRAALVIISALLIMTVACNGSDDEPRFEGTTVDTGPFTIILPAGWSYVPREGFDSFAGEFSGDGQTIFFEYGRYSGGLAAYEDDPAFVVTREKFDGLNATFLRPAGGVSGFTAASIVVKDDSGVLRTTVLLRGDDVASSAQALAFDIFRTVRFEDELE